MAEALPTNPTNPALVPTNPACLHCDERVGAEQWPVLTVYVHGDPPASEPRWLHADCSVRSGVGSVGHLLNLCSCYGGTYHDPPWLTTRESAVLAAAIARSLPLDRFDRPAFREGLVRGR